MPPELLKLEKQQSFIAGILVGLLIATITTMLLWFIIF